ncbi:MAG: hypothetical protein HYT11_03385 [Candidatus Levybacteria bacterium]|nr:hypothetical protein [Candidatus Levybacteria bacterium]
MPLTERLQKYNPDIYTTPDAKHFLDKTNDKKYAFGTEQIDPCSTEDLAKIYSLPPTVLNDIQTIVKNTGHIHLLPFVMGTYQINSREMRMNDICLTDPFAAYLMATKGIEGYAYPFLRGIYYGGRRSWWRHESIHIQHHLNTAFYLNARDQKEKRAPRFRHWDNKESMNEAGYTIHESGAEELMTRWQSLKEARGKREKAVSAASLLFTLSMRHLPVFATCLLMEKIK